MKKEWIDVCSYDGEGYLPLITTIFREGQAV